MQRLILSARGRRLALSCLPAALLGAVLLPLLADAQAATAPRAAAASFRDCPTCPEWVRIAPGRFLMGSTESEGTAAQIRADRAAAERPQLEIHIVTFFDPVTEKFAYFPTPRQGDNPGLDLTRDGALVYTMRSNNQAAIGMFFPEVSRMSGYAAFR